MRGCTALNAKSIQSVFLFTLIISFYSCKKGIDSSTNEVIKPEVQTLTVVSDFYSKTTINYYATVVNDGGASSYIRGICWSQMNAIPSLADNVVENGTGVGNYDGQINNLLPGTIYYVRSYLKTPTNVYYGETLSATTNLSNTGIGILDQELVVMNGTWRCKGLVFMGSVYNYSPWNASLTNTTVGVCFSTKPNPTISDSIIYDDYFYPRANDGSNFECRLHPTINTTYFIRAFVKNEYDTVYSKEMTFSTGVEIGLFHGGGIIFFVDETNAHGLIASLDDQAKSDPWAKTGYAYTMSYIGGNDGEVNTTNIINFMGNSGVYAAKTARDYRAGGFTDWYLPSPHEFELMISKAVMIGNFPIYGSAGNNYYYWTSGEVDYFRAYHYNIFINFSGTAVITQLGIAEKTVQERVRAIRAF